MMKKILLILLKPLMSQTVFLKWFLQNKLVVFVFHDVSEKPSRFSKENDLNVSPVNFNKQIEFIEKYFRIISPDQLENLSAKPCTTPFALITFDDGYESLFEWTFEFLERKKIPAILFVSGEVFEGMPITSGKIDYLVRFEESFKIYCLQKFKFFKRTMFTDITPSDLVEYETRHDVEMSKINDYCQEELSVKDLEKFKDSDYIFYGHHLYNHFNGLLLSEAELALQFEKNTRILASFSNYLNIFSATFGISNERLRNNVLSQQKVEAFFGRNNAFNINGKGCKHLNRISIGSYVDTENDFIFELNKRILKSLTPKFFNY